MGGPKRQKSPIVGQAPKAIRSKVEELAKDDRPILLVGPRGCGKELLARHYMASNPKRKRNSTINCAAISDALLPSEVFGHQIGAFTGAIKNREGKYKSCHEGILFLDELGDASPQFQAAILRVSEGNSYSPVGADDEISGIDTLIIAATNKPEALRPDLKDRFHIIYVPPLLKSDIPALAEHFLGKPLKPEVIDELMNRDYPGNIRELTGC